MKKILYTFLLSLISVIGYSQINVGSNFNITGQVPIDTRMIVADTAALHAISSMQRYDGLMTYVLSDSAYYQLTNGILNSNWKKFSAGGSDLWKLYRNAITQKDSTNNFLLKNSSGERAYEFTPHAKIGQGLNIITNTPHGRKTNLFTNPSFEVYTDSMLYFNNWDVPSKSDDNATERDYSYSTNAYHGTYSFYFDTASYNTSNRMSQTLNANPSTNYTTSFYGYGVGVSDSAYVTIIDEQNNIGWDFLDSTWVVLDSLYKYPFYSELPNGAWGRIELPYFTTEPYQSSFRLIFQMKEDTMSGYIDAVQIDTGVAAKPFAIGGMVHNASFERFFGYKPANFNFELPSEAYFNYFESNTNWQAGTDAADGVRSMQVNLDMYGSPLITTGWAYGLFSQEATFSYKAKCKDTSYVTYLLIDGNTFFDIENARVWNFITEQFEAFDLRTGLGNIVPYIHVDTIYSTYDTYSYTFGSSADILQQFTVMMYFGNFPPLITDAGNDTISIDSWQVEAGGYVTPFNDVYTKNKLANPMFQYTTDTTYWRLFSPGGGGSGDSKLEYTTDAKSPTKTAMLMTTDTSATLLGLSQSMNLNNDYNYNVSFYVRGRQAHDTIGIIMINNEGSSPSKYFNFATLKWDTVSGVPGFNNLKFIALDTNYQRVTQTFVPDVNTSVPTIIAAFSGNVPGTSVGASQKSDSIYFQGFQLEYGDTCTDVFFNDRYKTYLANGVILNSDTGNLLGSEFFKENDAVFGYVNSSVPNANSFVVLGNGGILGASNVPTGNSMFKLENKGHEWFGVDAGDDSIRNEAVYNNTDIYFDDDSAKIGLYTSLIKLKHFSINLFADTTYINKGSNRFSQPTNAGVPGNAMMMGLNSKAYWGVITPATSYWTLIGNDIYSNNVGNVGIGTVSPFAKLHVVGDISATGDYKIFNATTIEKFKMHYASTTETGFPFELFTISTKNADANQNGVYLFLQSSDAGVRGTVGNGFNGGVVGMVGGNGGNANIAGSGGNGGDVLMYGGSGGVGAGGGNGAYGNVILAYSMAASLPVGKVGIGLSNPSATLDVNGDIHLKYWGAANTIDTLTSFGLDRVGTDSILATTQTVSITRDSILSTVLDTLGYYITGDSTFNLIEAAGDSLSVKIGDTLSYYSLTDTITKWLSAKVDTSDFNNLVDRFEADSIVKNDSLLTKLSIADSIILYVTPTQLHQTIHDSIEAYKATQHLSTAIRYLNGGDLIVADTGTIYVQGNGSAVTLTSIPSITDTGVGSLSDYVFTIIGTSDVNTLTIQSDAQLTNSGLKLSGTMNITLGANDVLVIRKLRYTNAFVEVSRSFN